MTQTGSLNYYRNIHEGQVYAVGKVQHRGRTVCTVLVEIYAKKRRNCWQREHSPCLQRRTE